MVTFGARRTSNDTPDGNDVGISSSALRKSSRREARAPEVDEWEGTTESDNEAKEAGFPDEQVRGNWSGFREKGPRSGVRKAIKHLGCLGSGVHVT
jgi:hypothetical protein